jgi:hypothetical protein
LGGALGLSSASVLPVAAHDPDDLGLGIDNPSAGGNTAVTTRLNAATGATPAFEVVQATGSAGEAISALGAGLNAAGTAGRGVHALGGNNGSTGSGGDGIRAEGGSLNAGGVGDVRVGGYGLLAFGGSGNVRGRGGYAVFAVGGNSTTVPGPGVFGRGGVQIAALNAIGGSGVHGEGGLDGGLLSRTGIGVVGESDQNYAIFGQSNGAVGIRGVSFGSVSAGVEGVAVGSGPGVWGFTTSGHAVLGNSSTGAGGVFSSQTGYGASVTSNQGAVGVHAKANGFAFYGEGNLACTGTGQFDGGVVTAHRMADGSTRATASITSPSSVVEDFGRARLVGGAATVELDRQFAELVSGNDYAVFLTPNGDSKGLYVSNKSASTFEVREQQGGTTSLDFDYRIVAKRSGPTALARFAELQSPPPPPATPAMPTLPRKMGRLADRGELDQPQSEGNPTDNRRGTAPSAPTPSGSAPTPRR